MPSIIEVDTIKNKTGTQNTVLSTDGSGNVTIANSTFSGTIGSSATFPSGSVIKAQLDVYSTNNNTSSPTSFVTAVESANYTIKKTGSTIYIDGHFQWNTANANSVIKIEFSDDNFSTSTNISTSATLGLRNNNSGLVDMLVPFHEKVTHGKNANDTIKFRVSCNRYQGGGTVQLNQNDSARIRIIEVV